MTFGAEGDEINRHWNFGVCALLRFHIYLYTPLDLKFAYSHSKWYLFVYSLAASFNSALRVKHHSIVAPDTILIQDLNPSIRSSNLKFIWNKFVAYLFVILYKIVVHKTQSFASLTHHLSDIPIMTNKRKQNGIYESDLQGRHSSKKTEILRMDKFTILKLWTKYKRNISLQDFANIVYIRVER